MRTRRFAISLLVLASVVLVPAGARAQSAIAGVVKDTTGAVMPGVTVEAASPALIEKVRAAITNDRGVYQIVELRPGTYTVTFTLSGFTTVKREALELPSNFTATINAELRVGALEETITVSGAAPVVDVTSTAKAQVLNRDVLETIPTGRTAQTTAALVPGVTMGTPDCWWKLASTSIKPIGRTPTNLGLRSPTARRHGTRGRLGATSRRAR